MSKIYDFDKYWIFSSQIQQFKLRGNFNKWQISIDVSIDVAQKLPKMSYTKFNFLSQVCIEKV